MPKPILIIDDEARIRELLVETLKTRGLESFAAQDGEDGVQQFDKRECSLVITDVMLPKMDGVAVVDKIRKHKKGKTIPIIMMSAVYRDLKTQGDLKKKYGVQFLVKPFSLKVLLQMLEAIFPEVAEKKVVKATVPEPEVGKVVTGELRHFCLPLILVSFFSDARTGLLTLKRGGQTIKMYLDQGVPVYGEARTPLKTREMVEDVLRSCFAWSDGQYSFEPLELLPLEIPKFKYDFYGIIYEGAKRYYRLEFLIGKFQKFQSHLVVKKEGFADKIATVGFSEKEKAMIEKIDGKRNVSELVTHAVGQIENLFQVLWILEFMDVISFEKA